MTLPITPTPQNEVLDFRVKLVEEGVQELKESVQEINKGVAGIDSTLKVIANAIIVTDDHEKRLRVLEAHVPEQKIVAKWVLGFVVATVGLVFAALFKLAVHS